LNYERLLIYNDMRKMYIVLALLLSVNLYSQIPEKMSYQAVVRDRDNKLVANSNIGMRISIVKETPTGSEIYSEIQVPQTNAAGLVSIEIGTGVSSKDFNNIDWSSGLYYIKTEIDPAGGTRYTIVAVSQLLSVPYSMHSKTSEYAKRADESDPLFVNSPAASLTFDDVTSISNKSAFALDYNNLVNKPATITPEQIQAIEDNSNKGAMTDAERFKLSKVEFGANKNVQPDWEAFSGDSYIKNKPLTITGNQASAIRTNSSKKSYPDDHRQKLEGVEVGAQRNVQSDWNAVSGDAYIQNKPFTITQEQINSITANANKVSYPDADRNKLAGIETGANRNVQSNWNATSGDAMIINKPFTITQEQATAISRNTLKRSFNDNYKTKLDGISAGANKNVNANWASNSGDAEILNKPVTITAEQTKNITDAKTKLAGIEEGAQVNVQADWNAASGDAVILNKPTTITTTQANAINANTAKKTYPDADKTKLAGIQTGADANVQSDWNQNNSSADDYIKNRPLGMIMHRSGTGSSFSIALSQSGSCPNVRVTGTTFLSSTVSTQKICMQFLDGGDNVIAIGSGHSITDNNSLIIGTGAVANDVIKSDFSGNNAELFVLAVNADKDSEISMDISFRYDSNSGMVYVSGNIVLKDDTYMLTSQTGMWLKLSSATTTIRKIKFVGNDGSTLGFSRLWAQGQFW
jgi:hypothetical protein